MSDFWGRSSCRNRWFDNDCKDRKDDRKDHCKDKKDDRRDDRKEKRHDRHDHNGNRCCK